MKVPLAKPAARRHIELIAARAHAIDADARRVELDGHHSPTTSWWSRPAPGCGRVRSPGLVEHAISTWTPADMLRLRAGFQELLDTAEGGTRQRVLFLVPPGNMCSGPLYEIVLMLDTWLRRKSARGRAEIVWTTCEDSFIHAFGPRLHDVAAAEFQRRGIESRTGWRVEEVRSGEVSYTNGERRPYDLLVAFPPVCRLHAIPRPRGG